MKTFVTALFVVAAVVISMLLGKYIVSTRDWRVRVAILVGSLVLWTACVWLMMLYWRNAYEQ
jgi:NADH:ubiquinone oxidoreductase subunit 6 (subunit J)